MRFSPCFFFFNATPPPEIYTLSLHDALPISRICGPPGAAVSVDVVNGLRAVAAAQRPGLRARAVPLDRKSTRLNSSHQIISYAVFCLKKKSEALPPLDKQPADAVGNHEQPRA